MLQHSKIMKQWSLIGLLLVSLILSGCAAGDLQRAMQSIQPQLALKDVHFTGITFDALDLAVAVNIHNPNPISIALAGFDYDLQLNETSFLKGEQTKTTKIEAMGDRELEIPIKINFKDVYKTFKSLEEQDQSAYQIGCGLIFNLPGLGKTRVPLEAKGEIPLVKFPDIEVRRLKIKKLGLTGAQLGLELRLKNSNAFNLLLNNLTYDFAVNGKSWATGAGENLSEVTSKGETSLELPMNLDFNQIGSSVTQILAGKEPLNYQLRGKLGVGSSLPLLNNVPIPLDYSGTLNISR
jgi:LEA14-like dessication related protein